jgi:hypothetical protein
MKWTKLKKLTLENFGPFLGKHEIEFPNSGLTLLRGLVTETGDGSGAGKTYLLNALSFLFGGCPFPSTEIQNWYTDEEPRAEAVLATDEGEITVTRYKGLTVKTPKHPKGVKGKLAEPVLDDIFGMSEKIRALCTYRGQKKPGIFIAMSDPQKKQFLSDLLDLERYETVANDAASRAKTLETQVTASQATLKASQDSLREAQERLSAHQAPDPLEIERLTAEASVCDSRNTEFEANAVVEQKLAQDVRVRLTADLDAEISILRSASENIGYQENPDIALAENELAQLAIKIEELRKTDRTEELSIEKQRSKLNEKLTRLRASVAELPKLNKNLQKLEEQKTSLEALVCPTCARTWVADESKWALEECKQTIIQTLSEIEIRNQELQEGLRVKDELGKIPVFYACPGLRAREQRQADLSIQVKAFRKLDSDDKEKITKEYRKKEDEIRNVSRIRIEAQSKTHIDKSREYTTQAQAGRIELRDIQAKIALLNQEGVRYQIAKESVDSQQVVVTKNQEQLEVIEKALKLELDVQAMVGREGFLGVIFEDILVEISTATNDILSRVANVRHLTFQFEATKESKAGNVTQRITPVIYSHGRKVSFDAGISGGMQTSVELAVDLGVADVIARRRGTYPGWLILDEPFEGLGGISKEAAMGMLEVYSRDRLVLIVDHSSEFQGLFQQIIEIEQTDGRSSIRA